MASVRFDDSKLKSVNSLIFCSFREIETPTAFHCFTFICERAYMLNFPGNSVIFKRNIVMFIVYVFLIWNGMHVQFHVESCDTALSTL